jgi:prolyl 4-hydroxylase
MSALINKLRNKFQKFLYRKNYYLSKVFPGQVPFAPIHYLPQGFSIHTIGETGIKVIDNFCTEEEANYLINKAKEHLFKSKVIQNNMAVDDPGRTSSHSVVFHRHYQDPMVLPIIARGAMLAGVPSGHAEQIYVSRYTEGELYHGHYDISDDFLASHRLCTMLIYLNSLDENQGGATYFRDLNTAVKPTAGRAVCWTNMNPDGSPHLETMHAALPPVGKNTEKWVIQLWFRPYRMHPIQSQLEARQARPGKALTGQEHLPEGVWTPSETTAEP